MEITLLPQKINGASCSPEGPQFKVASNAIRKGLAAMFAVLSVAAIILFAPYSARAVELTFGSASDYDNNFYEINGAQNVSWTGTNGGMISGTHLSTAATTALYSPGAGSAGLGLGGTSAGTLTKFTNFSIQASYSATDVSQGLSLGFYFKVNDAATSGYCGIFRFFPNTTSTSSATTSSFRLFESNSNPSTSGVSATVPTEFTVATGAFASNTTYNFRLDVQDSGLNVVTTAFMYNASGTLLGSVSVTDSSSAVTGAGQVALRMSANSGLGTTEKFFEDNFRIVTTGWAMDAGGDFNAASNWVNASGTGTFDSSATFTSARTVTFAADTALTNGLTFNYTGNVGLTLSSSNSTPHTVTLGSDMAVNPVSNQTVTIGDATNVLNVDLGGATRTVTVNAGKTLTLVNTVSNGGITLTGSGTMNMKGTSTYSGATTIKAGALVVSGSLAASTVTVGDSGNAAAIAVLRGSGSVAGINAITSGASVTPGNSSNVAGILNAGSISVTGGAHLAMEIGGTTAGGENTTGYDRIVSAGAVTLTGGDLTLTLMGVPSFTSSDVLYLIVNNSGGAMTGTISTLNGASFDPNSITLSGQQFKLVYDGNFAGAGTDGIANDLALVAIPEPATWAMLVGGLGVLAGYQRRRRS